MPFLRGTRYPLLTAGSLGGAGFSPISLNPYLWLDPSDLTTLFQERTGASATTPSVVDGVVGTILDKSGNARHLVAPSDAARPLLKNSGAVYWLEFDGSDDRMAALFSLSQPISRVGAYQFITVDNNYRMLVGGGTGAGDMLYSLNTNSLRMFAGSEQEFATNPAAGTDMVVTELFNGAASQGAIDNGSYTVVNPGTGATDGITLGDQGDGAGFANCRHYGLVQRGSAFSDEEVALLRTYLAAKQGRVL
jgi:hypothetical protein